MTSIKSLIVPRVETEVEQLPDFKLADSLAKITIDDYLWMNNNYAPGVEAGIGYSSSYLFLFFKAYETEIKATFTEINSPVYKDSCVEFFFNPFPADTERYFNFEVNPLGTMLSEFGTSRQRKLLTTKEINEIKIIASVKKPVVGFHGNESWQILYKIPFSLFERYYGRKFSFGKGKGNFYKCGDEAKFRHYGVWNRIVSEKPNFHLPQFFGELIFGKS